ncbi:MAG: DUF499 domain-containing protein, partial [Methanosarcinales archaeon]
MIQDLVRPREEVLKEGIEGRVDVYKAVIKEGIESDPERFLEITFLTEPLKEVFGELNKKFKPEKGAKGVYTFSGGYGSGKSHHLLALFHTLNSPEIGKNWLLSNGLSYTIPENTISILIQALSIDPDYLWEPIFEGLGRDDVQVKRVPTHEQIKEALDKEHVVIFLDEIESWFEGLDSDTQRQRNLNFLQNLTEVASDSGSNLVVFISLLGISDDIKGVVNRSDSYWINLYGIKDRDKIVFYRLFHTEDKERHKDGIKTVIDQYISAYKKAGIFRDRSVRTQKRIEDLKNKMFESYPFHPQVIETLFEKYGASRTYQRTRGILYLLSSVVQDLYDKKDLIILSDIDPEKYDEFSKLESELSEKAIIDIRKTSEIGIKYAKPILSTIFIKSIASGTSRGASREDILFGVIYPSINVNDIDSAITELGNTAPHLNQIEGKYFIQLEENILVLIENEARQLKDKTIVSEKLAEIIKNEIK